MEKKTMTVPVLLNALQIAWVSLLRDESITDYNISTAPLTLVAAVLEASTEGEQDEQLLAQAALLRWHLTNSSVSVH
jgi:hypothetical protein